MAIKRKGQDPTGPDHPAEFQNHVTKAFTLQQIRDKYDGAFKDEKEWIVGYLENNEDGVEVTQGKALKVEHGQLIYTSRDNWKIDVDKIQEMVLDGTLTLTTLLQIASINAKKLKDMLGEAKFAKVATNEPTESLTMKADAEFKTEIDRMFDVETSIGTNISEGREAARKDLQAIEPPKAKVDPFKVKSSLAKAKAAQAKPLAKGDVDADLDAILNGK